MASSPATRVAAGPGPTTTAPHRRRHGRRPGLDRLQPRPPQPAQAPSSRASTRRVEPQRRVRPGQPAQDPRHHRQPGPPRLRRPLLVAHRPLQPAQLDQRRRREHLHRPPPGPSSRVARHRHVRPPRPPHQLHRPHPPPEQPKIRRVRPSPQVPVPPLQLRLTPPPGPGRVAHHQRRVQGHHRPTCVMAFQEPRQLLVGGRPPLGHHHPPGSSTPAPKAAPPQASRSPRTATRSRLHPSCSGRDTY